MVAWIKLGRVAGLYIKQIRAENPPLSQDFKLQAAERSLKLSLTP